jgi:ABC-type transport system involved in multi-copper enzyme maturation permease subunit
VATTVTSMAHPAIVLARKDAGDAVRTRLVLIVTGFLLLASFVSLVVAALALRADSAAYYDARETLIALGKSADALAPPAFFPLRLMRGFIEHLEIIGAVLGIILGHGAAAGERGRNTLALILTRPVSQTSFVLGKALGGALLIFGGLAIVFLVSIAAILALGRVGLSGEELGKVAIVYASSSCYVMAFFLLGFLLALWMRRLPDAILTAFTVWLVLVLITPQIGDTLDPDNQVAGGVFKQLAIPKAQEKEILASFASYETVRNGIEELSPAKHFERLSFALLGIKEIYNGQPLGMVMSDKGTELIWLTGYLVALLALLLTRRIDFNRLTRD